MWNICLTRNDLIFNAKVLPMHALILKIDRILLSWFTNCAERAKGKLEDSMTTIRHRLEFLRPNIDESSGVPTSEEV